MRLFIAVNLNNTMKDYLSEAIQKLKVKASEGNFTRIENLHLTLVFLGEVGEERLDAVKSAINYVNAEPFRLSLEGFGRFKRRGGDIHWAGIAANDTLLSIQKQLSMELKKAGFTLEEREFRPHLTLGREVRITGETADIYGALADRKCEMTVEKMSLMKSERINGRLVYSEIYGKELN